MTYFFDMFGWLTDIPQIGRQTGTEPPTHIQSPTEGEPWPNWTGTDWVMVPYVKPLTPEPQPAPEPINAWWTYVGPFFDRFGALKWNILSSSDSMVQALIKDCSVRKYIDLKRSDLPGALDILISKGFPIDKAAILTNPVAENERFVG